MHPTGVSHSGCRKRREKNGCPRISARSKATHSGYLRDGTKTRSAALDIASGYAGAK